jgi:carbamate kinase
LARKVPSHVSDAVRSTRMRGIRVVDEARRRYPSGSIAAQILGITGVDGEGLEGLEAVYDDVLMGDGVEYRALKDHSNRVIDYEALMARRSTEGDTLVLTLDRAIQIRAEELLILTEVDRVCLRFGQPDVRRLDHLTATEAEQYLAAGEFPPGSMGPKVEAAVKFVRNGGRRAVITSFAGITEFLAGSGGTVITP